MQRKPVKEYGGILSAITKAKFRLHLQAEQAYYAKEAHRIGEELKECVMFIQCRYKYEL